MWSKNKNKYIDSSKIDPFARNLVTTHQTLG